MTKLVGLTKKMKALTSRIPSSLPTSGLSTSLAFTPVQGLELENPDQKKKDMEALNNRWFSSIRK